MSLDINDYNKWLSTFKEWKVRRWHIINYLIQKYNYKSYLEIGISNGLCFKEIVIDKKDGVDTCPSEYVNHLMTSDQYFEKLKDTDKYDIIFIDGLHQDYQVYKDIINALKHLNENGIILCHDMNPPHELCQSENMIAMGPWNGNGWKAFAKLRSTRKDLEMYVINTDWGLGVIRKGKQKLIPIPFILSYEFLEDNRDEILNLIEVEDFYKMF